MWPFSWFSDDGPTYPEVEIVEVERELTGEVEFPTVELRWAGDREPETVTSPIEDKGHGLSIQWVEPYVDKDIRFGTAHLKFNYWMKRFVPYENLEDWEIIDRATREYSRTGTVREQRLVDDDE